MKRNSVAWAALIVSSAALASSSGLVRTAPATPQIAAESQKTARSLSDAFVGVSEFVKPSVVQISTQRKMSVPKGMSPFGRGPNGANPHGNVNPKDFEEFFKKFFNPDGSPRFEKEQFGAARGTGSGFIYDDRGHILTNNHVVEGSDKIVVTFHDGEEAVAKIVGSDPKTDVAVIKVDATTYRPAARGKSSKLKVGELVLAVGSPFGLEQTVTTGIVSALGRNDESLLSKDITYGDFIQTDAAINPGNSGGPLVDMDGHVVGINSQIATSSGSSAGVGFAIPIDMASNVAESLIKDGKVRRGAMGIALNTLTPALAKALVGDPKTKGVIVRDVFPNTPAAKAGLKQGDVITKFDETPARDVQSFRNYVATSDLDKPHTLTFFHDGQVKTAQVTLEPADKVLPSTEEKPAPAVAEKKEEKAAKVELGEFGIEVQAMTPELAKSFGFSEQAKGVLISKVKPDSPAEAEGLKEGMLISSIVADKRVQAVETPKQFLELSAKADVLAFKVETPRGSQFVTLARPSKEKG
jgi:serine protease Do